jgi:hypothetical protein
MKQSLFVIDTIPKNYLKVIQKAMTGTDGLAPFSPLNKDKKLFKRRTSVKLNRGLMKKMISLFSILAEKKNAF